MNSDFKTIFSAHKGTRLLTRLVEELRSSARAANQSAERVRALAALLEQDSRLQSEFAATIRTTFSGRRLVHVLAESGIISGRGIWTGLRRIFGAALLPRAIPRDDLRRVLHAVFPDRDDWEWVHAVSDEVWARLVRLVIEESDAIGLPHEDVGAAVRALAIRIAALGIDEEVNAKLFHVEDYDSPFMQLPIVAQHFLEDHRDGPGSRETLDAVLKIARECRGLVLQLRDNKDRYGTSMRLTGVTRRLLQQLNRFGLMLQIIHPNDPDEFARAVVPIFKNLIKAEQTFASPARLFRQNLDLIAYQITEHTADKGEKYVARSVRDYFAFLFAAVGGGALVAVFAVFKLFLAKLDLAPAVQAVVYGLNYSLCFILIYVTGAILATKQPAITASTIARTIDTSEDDETTLYHTADVIILVWRSQFVSFVGNLICAFPIAIAIAFALEQVFGVLTVDLEQSRYLLESNHPLRSGALFYAGIAGVFLFVAGVIQGVVDNRIVFTDLRRRWFESGRLRWLGRLREGFIDFILGKASGIIGNMVLGFLLGSAGTVGFIFGLPIDIRHIAFSSAHFGVATLDTPELVNPDTLYYVIAGIFGIGLVNFLVSFGLTLFVTFRSRSVSFQYGGRLLGILVREFFHHPLAWFFPVSGSTFARETPRTFPRQ